MGINHIKLSHEIDEVKVQWVDYGLLRSHFLHKWYFHIQIQVLWPLTFCFKYSIYQATILAIKYYLV